MPSDEPSNVFLHYFEFWFYLRELLGILIDNGLFQYVTRRSEAALRRLEPKVYELAPIADPATLDILYDFIAAGCISLVENWYRNGCVESSAQMAALAYRAAKGELDCSVLYHDHSQ